MGLDYYLKGVQLEAEFYEDTCFCDYGIDLEELNNEQVLESIITWNKRMLDAQRTP